jgi:hypothetical protein
MYDTLQCSSNVSWNYVNMYPFLNNVGSAVTEIIWKFDHKFMGPNYVTETIRSFYDIIWIMIV